MKRILIKHLIFMESKLNTWVTKKLFLSILTILSISFELFAQEETVTENEFKPNGRAFVKVFWNYNYNFSKETHLHCREPIWVTNTISVKIYPLKSLSMVHALQMPATLLFFLKLLN